MGVQWVGLALMTYGLFSGLAALITGWIVEYVPEYVVVYTGISFNLTWILFFLFWTKSPNFFVVFGFAMNWGLSNGIWNTMSPGEKIYSGIFMGCHKQHYICILEGANV